jgi:membrane-associated protein
VGFLALFVAEALAWAGVPAIGAAAMAAGGALASQGLVPLWAVIVIGTIGAELGSLGGWWIGRRIAERARAGTGRLATRRDRALDAGEQIERKCGRLIVFFVPSWVSGALAMPFGQFARWNILAATLWMIGAGLGAYGIGAAVSGGTFGDSALALALAALALATIAWLLLRRHRHGPAAS